MGPRFEETDLQKAHAEEIEAELHDRFMKRFPRDTLSALESIEHHLQQISNDGSSEERLAAVQEYLMYILMRAKSIDEKLSTIKLLIWVITALLGILVFK